MVTLRRVHPHTLLLLLFVVHLSKPVCVDVPSDTEAVLGNSMKLTCISCLKREEVKVDTHVIWYFTPTETQNKTKIFKVENDVKEPIDGHFDGRLTWNGSKDLQDLSLWILNVSERDHGFYECEVFRTFDFGAFKPTARRNINFTLTVKEKASNDPAAIYSEIMMYVLLVFLTLWLLVEMVYCYKKISKSDDQAQDALSVPDLYEMDDFLHSSEKVLTTQDNGTDCPIHSVPP
ncbi:sodium channel subunit beta-3 isoform X1 [Cyprinodon tularosa]|uniref:sodium channel subunit beta-3 isoform X1 n=1 Tax=Cyprinodon tularosa TaxID=77115 RepID=UPI0018E24022|nr:sodium channel subunit beta-3 isoform X1 [Cyprinodon tularosa]